MKSKKYFLSVLLEILYIIVAVVITFICSQILVGHRPLYVELLIAVVFILFFGFLFIPYGNWVKKKTGFKLFDLKKEK